MSSVHVEDPYRYVILSDGTELGCKALIIATGVTVKRLRARCQPAYGGGCLLWRCLDRGCQLSRPTRLRCRRRQLRGRAPCSFSAFCRQDLTMLVRGDGLAASMSQYLIDQIAGTPSIDVLTHTQVAEAHGKDRLEAITIAGRWLAGDCTRRGAVSLYWRRPSFGVGGGRGRTQ